MASLTTKLKDRPMARLGPYRIGRFAADVAEIAPAVSYRQFLAYVRDWLIGVSPFVCVRDF
jgi:hypothetical protein